LAKMSMAMPPWSRSFEKARITGAWRQAADHNSLVLQFHGQGLGEIQHIDFRGPIGGEIGVGW
jgi:hypothetical protein